MKLTDWAKTIDILVGGLPADLQVLRKQAEGKAIAEGRARSAVKTPAYLIAHVRHRYTNYETLLDKINRHITADSPFCAQEVLWERVNVVIEKEMDRMYGREWR